MSARTASAAPGTTLRRLSLVQPAEVETDPRGVPVRLDGRTVEQVRERWVVEEGWWTDTPVRRAYAELVLAGGGLEVVFEDLAGGGWHRHTRPRGRSATRRSGVRTARP